MRLKPLLTWCAICVGAYVGALQRYGFSFFKTAAAGHDAMPSAATGVLLANVVGSFCLGFISMWQAALAAKTAPRLSRVLYAGFASGYCGTLTTFSGWQAEAARPLLRQLEGVSAAPNGTDVFGWLLLLLIGVLVPLASMRAGQQLGHVVQARQQRRAEALAPAVAPLPPPALAPSAAVLEAVTEAVDTALQEQAPGLPVDRDESTTNGQRSLLGVRQELATPVTPAAAGLPSPGDADAATPAAAGLLAVGGSRSGDGGGGVVRDSTSCTVAVDIDVAIAPAADADAATAAADDVGRPALRRVSFSLTPATAASPQALITPTAAPPPAALAAASVAEACIIAAYAAATAVLAGVLVPLARYDLAIMVGLACVGAYTRYRLAVLNQPVASSSGSNSGTGSGLPLPATTLVGRWRCAVTAYLQPFPLGTFLVNVAGTWIFAAVVVLARRVVSADASGTQALLFGVSAGFCGALTTTSTFVLELRRLPLHAAYCYAALSTAFAQLGFLLIVGLGLTGGRASF